MVIVMASAMGEQGIDIAYAVQPRSLVIGYAIGVLLTLAVVVVSARRVSVMTIAAAIRNLPEPCRSRAAALAARRPGSSLGRCSRSPGVVGRRDRR